MAENDNPLFHLEPVAVEAVSRKYGDKVPETFPANIENAMIGYSIAISLKRIADVLDGTSTGMCVTETIFGRKP